MSEWIVRTQLETAFQNLQLPNGGCILVQASNAFCHQVYGGAQCLFQTLARITGKKGTLMIPAFTPQCLLPACIHAPYANWPLLEANILGYSQSSLPASELAAAAMLYKAKRTTHPVYSMLFYGSAETAWVQQPLDYPLSLDAILQVFKDPQKKAVNLLLDVNLQDSLLLHALALEQNAGLTFVQQAASVKDRKTSWHSFLAFLPDGQAMAKLEKGLQQSYEVISERAMISLSLSSSPASKPATLQMLLDKAASKLEN